MTGTGSELCAARAAAERLLRRDERTLVAVSGGLDSMCLLHFLHGEGYPVAAAHFNHMLRGAQSDADEAFVRNWCAARGIELLVGRGDVRAQARGHGRSVEETARRLRYDFLRRAMREARCGCIAVAQHMDDNAETVLLNLVRGTGVAGLCGMRERQGDVVRPFLGQSRAELARYAGAVGLAHVEDATNLDPDAAARNRLRLNVMPELEKLNPRAAGHICAAAGDLCALDDALEREARGRTACARDSGGGISVPCSVFSGAPRELCARMALCLIDRLGTPRADVGRVHLDALVDLALSGRAASLSLPHGVWARCAGGTLCLVRRAAPPSAALLPPGTAVRWGAYELTLLPRPDGEGVALRAGTKPLYVAPCDPRAYLALAGSRGARSVKRLCTERGIPPHVRDTLPMLREGERAAAVWTLGTDAAFLPEGEEMRFVRIRAAEDHRQTCGDEPLV